MLMGALGDMVGQRSGRLDLVELELGPLRLRTAAQRARPVSPANAERYVRALTQLVPKVPAGQRLRVMGIVVDAAAVAGNLAYDHDRPDRSAAIARTVHGLATEVGDEEGAALMTARMSSALVKLGQPDVAVAALERVRPEQLPAHTTAMLEVHRAGALGSVGDSYEALAALERAEDALAASDPAGRPSWARHWTEDYVRHWRVLTLGRLGWHDRAEPVAREALRSLPEHHVRVRAHLLLCLAEIAARGGRVAEAAVHAAEALTIAPRRADRFTHRASRLRAALTAQHRGDPAVLDALGALDEALSIPARLPAQV